ncbi:pyruvate ferredoxin oxidoreductase [Acidaminobacter sp. JC074]|uniref:pyruvate ferredoxin oxidoreductase n=1 Tax=Acidaminobacter sp. JC074 TaxID=2530199 RepID=UPI001F0D8A6F|nr:pyruvate ferredoxin oxidoreductase [Acidaminobacter sp. JC074]MCH4889782.1 pyruvate ferredoxin oxidoreductase [Acidaminobacter sp. JC074]
MKKFISGNDAVAEGVRLAKPHVISAYPITPQTIAVERLSEMVEDGSLKAEYMHVESEHSALAAAMGVSSVGARAFTATSSQGLLYMSECLPYASGARMPIVMMNANRALATPWNIYGDQMDSMAVLNAGWIQVYVEDAQEALDMMIQAYKIAEHPQVLAPMMVNLDGFVLTHTYELVDIPEQTKVDEFLPPIQLSKQIMDVNDPKSLCISAGNDFNMEFKIKQEKDLQASRKIINEVDKSFGDMFGRYYNGMIDTYMCEDADYVLVTTGSVTGTVRIVIDKMRAEGHKVGVLKLRYVRPFPVQEVRDVLKNVKKIGIIDKNISFGYEGTMFTNVNSALLDMDNAPKSYNFIGGLGGRDITKENITEVYEKLMSDEPIDKVNYMNVRCDV